MNFKKLTSCVMAGLFAVGVSAVTLPAMSVEAADSPYCATVEQVAPEGGDQKHDA